MTLARRAVRLWSLVPRPSSQRALVTFRDAIGAIRGATSAAVRTQ